MKIAIVGSGIAGLSAAWYLKNQHDVTIYERGPKLGMDAHTATVNCGNTQVDINVPMRVFFPEYYPTLTALYEAIGVAFEPVQYSASFSHHRGKSYFHYKNYWLGRFAIPFLAGNSLRSPNALRIGTELIRLLRQSKKHLQHQNLDAITIDDYLRRDGYSRLFSQQFLYPTFAGICTCSYEAVSRYPAAIILDYLNSGLTWSKVNRLTHGTEDAATRLAAAAHKVCLNTTLQSIEPDKSGVTVTDSDGVKARYDHVVLATQANHSIPLLADGCKKEKAVLSEFSYEKSQLVVHRDTTLAPEDQADWAPVNFVTSAKHNKPMASILLNRIHPELVGEPSIFETWNPFTAVANEDMVLKASVERPVVTTESLQAIADLDKLHDQPHCRLWFCGSYASRGIPLLESATASAKNIADKLNS